ncbi:hypothetical protein [Candidatus Palauibacter sp.]|uniref:hypothetical protein n=1 Tax=Candidatus Palauibacter sp. TaxID=3101350 RepID=UPI003B51D636
MRRLANSLLLIALVLPYARAPLCEAGSHEHPEHQHAGMVAAFADAPGDGSDAPGDCHSLMGCTVVLQTSLAAAGPGFRAFSQAWHPALQGSAALILSRASPDPPPPRTV